MNRIGSLCELAGYASFGSCRMRGGPAPQKRVRKTRGYRARPKVDATPSAQLQASLAPGGPLFSFFFYILPTCRRHGDPAGSQSEPILLI